MTATNSGRVHLITGGFPPGSMSGHDHDYARLRLLGLLAEQDIPASVANDFVDVEKWLPVSQLLITYVAGPYPDAAQTRAIRQWLSDPAADLQDSRRGQRRRFPPQPRARRVVRRRGRAVLRRAARSGLDTDPLDRGIQRERRMAS